MRVPWLPSVPFVYDVVRTSRYHTPCWAASAWSRLVVCLVWPALGPGTPSARPGPSSWMVVMFAAAAMIWAATRGARCSHVWLSWIAAERTLKSPIRNAVPAPTLAGCTAAYCWYGQ